MEWLDNNLQTSKSAKVFKQAYRTHLKTGGRPSAEPAGDHDNLGQAPKITDSSVKPLLEFYPCESECDPDSRVKGAVS